MTEEQQKKHILTFLQPRQLGVISTVNNQKTPESALVAFTQTPQLELIFCTSITTRKYQNIRENPHVSMVIGWDSGTVQYEGEACELAGEDVEKYGKLHAEKNPQTKQFMNQEDKRYFLIRPTWIRFLDLSEKAPQRYEISYSY